MTRGRGAAPGAGCRVIGGADGVDGVELEAGHVLYAMGDLGVAVLWRVGVEDIVAAPVGSDLAERYAEALHDAPTDADAQAALCGWWYCSDDVEPTGPYATVEAAMAAAYGAALRVARFLVDVRCDAHASDV